MAKHKSKYLQGKRIDPAPITNKTSVADLIDESFLAYNAARLREACQLFTNRMLEPEVTVGMSITGALTPAGLGISALIPLIKAGFVDWIISTGANLYHDTHFGIGLSMHLGNAQTSDVVLREEEVVRIYDIFFDYSVLLDTDAFFRKIIEGPEFQHPMSTAEFHYLCGRYVYEREKKLGQQRLLTDTEFLFAFTISAAATFMNAKRNSVSVRSRCWPLRMNMRFPFTLRRRAILRSA